MILFSHYLVTDTPIGLKILKEVGVEKDVSYRPAKLYSVRGRVPEIIELV